MVSVCVCVFREGRGGIEYFNKIFRFFCLFYIYEILINVFMYYYMKLFMCLMLLLDNYMEGFDIWNFKVIYFWYL